MEFDQDRPLEEFLTDEGVLGAVRWIERPSFIPKRVNTFVYFTDAVIVATKKTRNAATLSPEVVRRMTTLPFASSCVPVRLASWDALLASARQAPSCSTLTLDGIGYEHHVRCRAETIDAEWSNPQFPQHAMQVYLVTDYQQLLEEADLFPEESEASRKRKLIRRQVQAEETRRKERRKRGG